jgi:hypothetical protein
MYYLNAFNEMLRKRRQQNNMMNGGGQDYPSRDYARPSGTDALGLGPAQDRNAFRDTLNSMSPMSRFAMGMMPVIGPAFNIGRLANAGMSAYEASQLAPSRDARERSQDQFRASEIADFNAPMQNTAQQSFRGSEIADSRSLNTPQQSFQTSERAGYGQAGPEYGPAPAAIFDPNAYEGAITENSFNAFNMGGGPGVAGSSGAPNFDRNAAFIEASRAAYNAAPAVVAGNPIAPSSLSGESLPTMATDTIGKYANMGDSGLRSGGFGQTGLYGDASAGMGTFGDSAVGFGGGFGGNIGTGNFGGSPADAADLGYAHGGMVDARHLKGRAPAPDDGYGALQGGEYVITKAAVEKYGKRLLDAINNGTFR